MHMDTLLLFAMSPVVHHISSSLLVYPHHNVCSIVCTDVVVHEFHSLRYSVCDRVTNFPSGRTPPNPDPPPLTSDPSQAREISVGISQSILV